VPGWPYVSVDRPLACPFGIVSGAGCMAPLNRFSRRSAAWLLHENPRDSRSSRAGI
jgi:hypothetical protein